MKKPIIIAVIVIASILTVAAMVFGVRKGMTYLNESGPRKAASSFVLDVTQGFTPSAYSQTTAEFQAKNNEQTFLKDFEVLEDETATYSQKEVVVGESGAIVTGVIRSGTGEDAVEYSTLVRLEKVDKEWRINSVAIL